MTDRDTTNPFTVHDTPEQIAADADRFPPGHPVYTALGRILSDIYSFWRLCDYAACRRAGRCVRDPARCRDACRPLIPDAAHQGGLRMFEARCHNLSFDEMLKRWPDEMQGLGVWLCGIARRGGGPRARRDAS